MVLSTYRQQLEPAVEHVERFCDFVRSVPADRLDLPVPGLAWDARDVVAHVTSVVRRYTVDLERADDRAALAARNADDVAAVREEFGGDVTAMADDLEQQMALISSVAPHLDPDEPRPFHLGVTVDLPTAWANLVAEVLVHGDDVARATGGSFTVPAADLEGIWRHLLPIGAAWLRSDARDVRERYETRFPFGTLHIELVEGAVRVADAPDPAIATTAVIDAADAVSTTLAFPYRRRLITDPALALLASRFHDI